MANVDKPMGFVPYQKIDGGDIISKVGKLSSSNTVIAPNDAIEWRSDGYLHIAQASSLTIEGVALKAVAANTGGTIEYVPVKGHRFIAQADEADIAAQTNIGLNYNIVATTSSGGKSLMEVDSSTGATTKTLPVKVVGLYEGGLGYTTPNAFGEFAKVIVEFNETAGAAGGTGV